MRHLTDDLIQKYLDKVEPVDRPEIENHLIVCHVCREKVEQYQELYLELYNDDIPLPNNTLNLNVISEIERLESRKKSHKLVAVLSSLSGIAAAFALLTYFGLVSWSGLFGVVGQVSTLIFRPLFDTAALFAEKLNGNLEILIFAAIAMLLFQMLDYGLVKRKSDRVRKFKHFTS